MAGESILEIKGVTKLYGKENGIKKISLKLKSGESAAVIGPNGAGKTTLVRAVCGLNRISEGQVLLDGIPVFRCREQIGYMQESLDFYEKMTVYEALDLMCEVKHKGKCFDEIDPSLEKYELYPVRNRRVGSLSLGMKRKLSVIMALLGPPGLLILDEPTNGIDTAGLIRLKQDLTEYREQGGITLLTSHVLEWAENICTRFVFLKEGTVAGDYQLEELETDLEDMYKTIYGKKLFEDNTGEII